MLWTTALWWSLIYLLTAICLVRSPPKPSLLWLFPIWSAITVLWSPDQGQGIVQAVNIACFAVLCGANPKLPVSAAVVATVVLSEFFPRYWGGFGNENFVAEFLLVAVLMCRWWAVLAVVYFFLFRNSASNWIGCAAVLGLYGVWWLCVQRRFILAGILALAGLNGLFWGLQSTDVALSVLARFELWFNTFQLILKAPFFGHGLGSFNYLYPTVQEEHLRAFPLFTSLMHDPSFYPGAAHNEFLQLVAETGLVGLILALPVIVIGLMGEGRWVLLMAAGVSLLGFPLQNPLTALVSCLALSASFASVSRSGFFTKVKDGLRQIWFSPVRVIWNPRAR